MTKRPWRRLHWKRRRLPDATPIHCLLHARIQSFQNITKKGSAHSQWIDEIIFPKHCLKFYSDSEDICTQIEGRNTYVSAIVFFNLFYKRIHKINLVASTFCCQLSTNDNRRTLFDSDLESNRETLLNSKLDVDRR